MGFLKRIFGKKEVQKEQKQKEEEQIPPDEFFAIHFIKKGGFFIYCASEMEVQDTFRNILKELGVQIKMSGNPSEVIRQHFEDYLSFFEQNGVEDSDVYVTDCEALLTSSAGIMFSPAQLKHRKFEELPKIFVVFATTSQMVKDIHEGMKVLKRKNNLSAPITPLTLQNFTGKPDKNSIDTFGLNSKKTYLILLEDLPLEQA